MAVEPAILRAAVMASGNGSNAENIVRHARLAGRMSIPLIICDQPEAYVIARARNLGVPCHIIPRETTRDDQERRILGVLEGQKIDYILLAGYMRILSAEFIRAYHNRIINIHPSLLPAFPGKDAYGEAFRAGASESGVTLHYVDEGIDSGPVIAQKSFKRLEGDTFESFRARGMKLEHEIYREFIDILIRSAAA